MKRDTGSEERVYQCQGWPATDDRSPRPCGVYHQESTVAVRYRFEGWWYKPYRYCDVCQSDDLKLCTKSETVDQE